VVAARRRRRDGLRSGASYRFRVTALDDFLAGGVSRSVSATVPRVAPVRNVRLSRSGPADAVARGDQVPFAESYLLRGAVTSSCVHPPAARLFHTWARGLLAPRHRFILSEVTRDPTAVRVRWYAVKDGVRGRAASSSVACLRLSR